MNEGNCACCGKGLHTKHRVTAHPVLKYTTDGLPVRGLEKDFNICGDCVGEDVGAKVADRQGVTAPKK